MKKKEVLIVLGRKFLIFIGGGIVFILFLVYGVVPAINFYYSLTERPVKKAPPSPQEAFEQPKEEEIVSVVKWPDFSKFPFVGGEPGRAGLNYRWVFLRNGQVWAVEKESPYFLAASSKNIVYFFPSPTRQYLAYEIADTFSLDLSPSVTKGLWVYDVLNKNHVNINMGKYDYYNNAPFGFVEWLPPFRESNESLIAAPHDVLSAGPSSLFSPQGDIIINGGLAAPVSDLVDELSSISFAKTPSKNGDYYGAFFRENSIFWINPSVYSAIEHEFLRVSSGAIGSFEWAPDGTKIAFVLRLKRNNDKRWLQSVWVADFPEKRLWEIKKFEDKDLHLGYITWSPKSQKILYSIPQIASYYVLNLQGNVLYQSEGKRLTWYKDEKIFEERRESDVKSSIYTVDLETKEEKLFLENACCIEPF